MKPFIVECGFTPIQVRDIHDAEVMGHRASGAVLGVGAASTLELTLSDAFKFIRRSAPELPIIFASLFDRKHAERAIRSLPIALDLEAPVADIEEYDPKVRSYIHVSIFDLDDPRRRQSANDIVRRYFSASTSHLDGKCRSAAVGSSGLG